MDTIYNANGCFYRALDDEPVFVLLARDPCTPEAIRWWVTLRQALIGRGEKPLEDHETLADALRAAMAAHTWRVDATDPTRYLEAPRWKAEPAPDRELVEAGLVDKLRDRIRELEEIISSGQNHTVETIKGLMTPEWNDQPTHPISTARICELLDYATVYGEWSEHTPNGTMTALAGGPMNDYQRAAILTYKKVLGLLPEDYHYPEMPTAMPFVAVDLTRKMATGLRQVTGDMQAYFGGDEINLPYADWIRVKTQALTYVDRLNGYAAELEASAPIIPEVIEAIGTEFDKGVMRPPIHGIPDFTAPTDTRDVTNVPDLPPHRFAMFDKGREWAYGRGLEINPSHIPAMLDRMEADGWHLVAALGVEASKVGMLFYRRQPSTFEIVHGYGDVDDTPRRAGSEDSPTMRAWAAGKPFSEIAGIVSDTEPRLLPQSIGKFDGHGVWVAATMPETLRACLRTAMSLPCGVAGQGRGLEA